MIECYVFCYSYNLAILVITMNYLTSISRDEFFVIIQTSFLAIILFKAFCDILFYIPDDIYYDMNCIALHSHNSHK